MIIGHEMTHGFDSIGTVQAGGCFLTRILSNYHCDVMISMSYYKSVNLGTNLDQGSQCTTHCPIIFSLWVGQ